MKRLSIIMFLIVGMFLVSCSRKKPEQTKKKVQIVYLVKSPDSSAQIVADSIIYSVVVKAPDSTDPWLLQSLQYTKPTKLLDLILHDIYTGKLVAYSYPAWVSFHKKVPIPPDSVRAMVNRIGEKRIGKIEFVERWFYSPKTHTFYKQVLEMTFGYEIYKKNGQLKGYSPLFKISFNPEDNKPMS